jgi:sugar (glycoside-pentoside-hexuronide) transporter
MNIIKNTNGYYTSVSERFSYGSYFLGQNIIWWMMANFLLIYYTDIGIGAATVAFIMFIAKLWDAINDPLFGSIMDKVRFKKSAKFLPWLRISLPFIILSIVLMFAVPLSMPMNAKIAWCLVVYLLFDTFYTMCDAPIYGLVTTMTINQKERTSIMTYGRYFGMAGGVLVGAIVPFIRTRVGGWAPAALIVGVIALITMLPAMFKTKERCAPPPKTEGEQSYKFSEILSYLVHNKYLLLFFAAQFISTIFNFTGNFNMHFARYCLGNEELMGTLLVVSMAPGIAVLAIFPFLSKRYDKYWLFFWSIAAGIIVNTATFFIGYHNLTIYIITRVVAGFPTTLAGLLLFMFTPDCVEYGHYKSGINASGIAFSFQTFSQKLIAAVSAALAGFALAIIGFVSGEGAAQAPEFADRLWVIMTLGPALASAVQLPILLLYKLRDHDVQIMAKANSGELSRDEAETMFTHKF